MPPPTAAAARPTCFGHKATIVGNNRGNHIKGTHHADVIAGLGGRDVIIGNGGRDIICGGSGNDRIYGGNAEPAQHDKPTTLIGGPGNDQHRGQLRQRFHRRRQRQPKGDAIGHVGRDKIDGEFGNDYIVGDNYSRFDATGGKHDLILGQKGNDTMIGDS